jgi:hypothetical protein
MALTSRNTIATKLDPYDHKGRASALPFFQLRTTILLAMLVAGRLAGTVTYHSEVAPVLEQHCVRCHRAGEIAPMAFQTYAQTRPWAAAIREQVLLRRMPPWFARGTQQGHFANDPSLTEREIAILREWADTGAAEGKIATPTPGKVWPAGWNIPRQDAIFQMEKPFQIPASGAVDYQYFVVPTGFTEDRWVHSVEIRPSARANVHHVVVYVREKDSPWLRDGNMRIPPKSDILLIYTPGSEARTLPAGMGKKVEAGSDLVFQIHYTTNGMAAEDRTKIALTFATEAPAKRVLTLQMGNSTFHIPPGEIRFPVLVRGTLPNDAELLSFFPHMHLRGSAFEYRIIPSKGPAEVLLHVEPYDFYWQLDYVLRIPLPLRAGTKFEWEAWFDNSAANARNPDAKATVGYGEQSWEEMMIGFFEVAVPAGMTKEKFFERAGSPLKPSTFGMN